MSYTVTLLSIERIAIAFGLAVKSASKSIAGSAANSVAADGNGFAGDTPSSSQKIDTQLAERLGIFLWGRTVIKLSSDLFSGFSSGTRSRQQISRRAFFFLCCTKCVPTKGFLAFAIANHLLLKDLEKSHCQPRYLVQMD